MKDFSIKKISDLPVKTGDLCGVDNSLYLVGKHRSVWKWDNHYRWENVVKAQPHRNVSSSVCHVLTKLENLKKTHVLVSIHNERVAVLHLDQEKNMKTSWNHLDIKLPESSIQGYYKTLIDDRKPEKLILFITQVVSHNFGLNIWKSRIEPFSLEGDADLKIPYTPMFFKGNVVVFQPSVIRFFKPKYGKEAIDLNLQHRRRLADLKYPDRFCGEKWVYNASLAAESDWHWTSVIVPQIFSVDISVCRPGASALDTFLQVYNWLGYPSTTFKSNHYTNAKCPESFTMAVATSIDGRMFWPGTYSLRFTNIGRPAVGFPVNAEVTYNCQLQCGSNEKTITLKMNTSSAFVLTLPDSNVSANTNASSVPVSALGTPGANFTTPPNYVKGGEITISTCKSGDNGKNTVLSLLDGNRTMFAVNDDSCFGGHETLRVPYAKKPWEWNATTNTSYRLPNHVYFGSTYTIRIASADHTSVPQYSLSFACAPPPTPRPTQFPTRRTYLPSKKPVSHRPTPPTPRPTYAIPTHIPTKSSAEEALDKKELIRAQARKFTTPGEMAAVYVAASIGTLCVFLGSLLAVYCYHQERKQKKYLKVVEDRSMNTMGMLSQRGIRPDPQQLASLGPKAVATLRTMSPGAMGSPTGFGTSPGFGGGMMAEPGMMASMVLASMSPRADPYNPNPFGNPLMEPRGGRARGRGRGGRRPRGRGVERGRPRGAERGRPRGAPRGRRPVRRVRRKAGGGRAGLQRATSIKDEVKGSQAVQEVKLTGNQGEFGESAL